MKRLALILIVLFTATSLLAGGGKSCDVNRQTKSVELTGTLAVTGEGDDAKTVFRVADTGQSYTVCEKTKRSVLELSKEPNANFRIKGKVVSCGEGEELVIVSAKKI